MGCEDSCGCYINKSVGRRKTISGSCRTARVHNVYSVGIGAVAYMGVSVECNITAVFLSSGEERSQVVVYTIAVTVSRKDTMSGRDVDYLEERSSASPVKVALYVVNL